MTASETGRRAKVHRIKISAAVQALETRRFLRRETYEENRRAETLGLISAGRAVFEDLGSTADLHDQDLLTRLPSDERQAFLRSMRALARVILP